MHQHLYLFDDQVRAGEERVMPGWQLNAACCSVRVEALQLNRGASVLPADDVGRVGSLPAGRAGRRHERSHSLRGYPVPRPLPTFVIGVLEEPVPE